MIQQFVQGVTSRVLQKFGSWYYEPYEYSLWSQLWTTSLLTGGCLVGNACTSLDEVVSTVMQCQQFGCYGRSGMEVFDGFQHHDITHAIWIKEEAIVRRRQRQGLWQGFIGFGHSFQVQKQWLTQYVHLGCLVVDCM